MTRIGHKRHGVGKDSINDLADDKCQVEGRPDGKRRTVRLRMMMVMAMRMVAVRMAPVIVSGVIVLVRHVE